MKKLVISYILVTVALVPMALVLGCKASPTSPADLPEPPQELLEAIPFPVPEEGPTDAWQEARHFFFTGYMRQLEGKLEEAIKLYQLSIDTFPTAEAYTFLGWTYSWMARYDDAIREAERAIALDPDYGNPYNDIGVYLMAQDRLDEAIPWLIKATEAKRYASPHYPWLNLGHIWVLKGDWGEALSIYEEVWKVTPDYQVPPTHALPAALFLPPEEARQPGTTAGQQAVKAAVTQYFESWNNYDADALKKYSAPIDIEATKALLLNLAAAKYAGATITVHDSRVLHIEDSIAIVEAGVFVLGKPELIWYLLRHIDGNLKVVASLYTDF